MDNKFGDFVIQDLGKRTIPSPVMVSYYTSDNKRILHNIYLECYKDVTTADGVPLSIEVAGPRERYFSIPSRPRRQSSHAAACARASTTSSGRFSWNCSIGTA